MIELKLVLALIAVIISVGGGIVGFFTMQTRQNMKIKALEDKVAELERKLLLSTGHQFETEKAIIEINAQLKHIVLAIDDLKKNGNKD